MSVRRLLLCALALLAACGQKGPLYLPDKNAKVITTPAAPAKPTPAPAATSPPADGGAQPPPARPKPPDQDDDSQPPK